MHMQKIATIVMLGMLVQSPEMFSQILLQGTITDNGGEYLGNGAEPVLDALVTVTDQSDTSRAFTSYTDEQGQYSIVIEATGIAEPGLSSPNDFTLHQNYPNPFNPTTVILYELTQPGHVRIDIHNILGQKVRTLVDGYQTEIGKIVWDGTDDRGIGVSAGVYIYSLSTESFRTCNKMVLLDGHQGQFVGGMLDTAIPTGKGPMALGKTTGNLYRLQVKGDDIETYEQSGIEITENQTLDITVYRTVTDINGNVYRTVKISDQWWMAENIKTTHYRNGDPIPNITNNTEWIQLISGSYCNYKNDDANVETYGRMYNWYAVNDHRGLAPEGWQAPSDEQLKQLERNLGIDQDDESKIGWRGTDQGGQLKEASTTHWYYPNTGATNKSGFAALPAGYRRSYNGSFDYVTLNAYFWSSTEYDSNNALCRSLCWINSNIMRIERCKTYGFSVRCVRDY
ncbi:MAG TPA: FISUMP domain-containing protein [bacterium]|nr:FISUMP domain-containing protein [bacterium]HPG46900.1 FISUMP domain-containing protein [bacterium]